MARYSVKREKNWDISFWLIFNADGSVRMTRGEPDCFGLERAMQVTAQVPHSLFSVPALSAKIVLGEREVPPVQLDIQAAENALSEMLGARIELTMKG